MAKNKILIADYDTQSLDDLVQLFEPFGLQILSWLMRHK